MSERLSNEAWVAAADELSSLSSLRALADELRAYPVTLLAQLCELAEKRQGPVPDHTVTLLPYLGETALRALVDGGYVERLDDVSYAIHAYLPTDKGKVLAASLREQPKARTKKR